MGVDLAIWRARIGGFSQPWSRTSWSAPTMYVPGGSVRLVLRISVTMALLLIVSGDVETNPGPPPTKSSSFPQTLTCEKIEEPRRNPGILQMFEDICTTHRERVAVVEPDGNHVTFSEIRRLYLNMVSSMSQLPLSKSTASKHVIATFMPRSLELIVTVLASWKLGMTFVMLDPTLPEERMLRILQDSAVDFIIYDEAEAHPCVMLREETQIISYQELMGQKKKKKNPVPSNTESNPTVNIFFTSGSTGVPKGVLINEAMWYHRLNWMWQELPFEEGECVAFKAKVTYATCVWEMVGGLLQGIRTAIIPDDVVKDPPRFLNHLYANKVTRLSLVSSFTRPLIEYALSTNKIFLLQTLKVLCCDGEVLSDHVAKLLLGSLPDCQIIHIYGSTEDGFDGFYSKIQISNRNLVSLGKPLQHMHIHLERTPVEGLFELYTSGPCLSDGYLNMPEKTMEKFPFIEGKRYYKTGDLVRIENDGSFLYVGRSDRQVKIRGHRVHLDEIEMVVQSCPCVSGACVVQSEKERTIQVVVTLKGEMPLCPKSHLNKLPLKTKEILNNHMKTRLPDFMTPAVFYEINSFPVGQNGKPDRNILVQMIDAVLMPHPIIDSEQGQSRDASPKEILEEIWQKILGFGTPGGESFVALGGHSLKAIDMANEIESRLRKYVPVSVLLNDCTFTNLLKYVAGSHDVSIDSSWNVNAALLLNASNKTDYRGAPDNVSFQEEDILLYHKLYNDSTAFNALYTYDIKKIKVREILQRIYTIIMENPVLCSTYIMNSDGGFSRNVLTLKVGNNGHPLLGNTDVVSVMDFSDIQKHDRYLKSLRFDPFSGKPLIKFILSTIEECDKNKYKFAAVMHHNVTDRISVDHIVRNLFATTPDRTTHRVQYGLFVESWRNFSTRENTEYKRRRAYWKKEISGSTMTGLPIHDLTERNEHVSDCNVKCLRVRADLHHQIQKISTEIGTTTNAIFLSTFAIALATYNQVDDVVFGLVHSNRLAKENKDSIGFHSDVIPLRIRTQGRPSTRTVLVRTTETLWKGMNNVLPSVKIFAGNREKKMGSFTRYKCLINFQQSLENAPQVICGDDEVFSSKLAWPMTFVIRQDDRREVVELHCLYRMELYDDDFITQFLSHYLNLLERGLANINRPFEELPILSVKEREEIIQLGTSIDAIDPFPQVLDQLFVDQVLKNPDETAVIHQGQSATYKDLFCMSAVIAGKITKYTRHHTGVCIYMHRSISLVAACLGCLMSGCFYVCIDPDLPTERVNYMVNDVGGFVILTDGVTHKRRSFDRVKNVNIEDLILLTDDSIDINAEKYRSPNSADDLCHVLYTSGTTGRPKGVCVPHKCVVVRVMAECITNVEVGDKIGQIASFSFDISAFDLFLGLTHGATLILLDRSVLFTSPAVCVSTIRSLNIDIMFLPTSLFHLLANYAGDGIFDGLRYLLICGDSPNQEQIEKVVKRDIGHFKSMYGPAEATVFALSYDLTAAPKIIQNCLGRPIPWTSVYITNSSLQLLPRGVQGEIVLGGAGISHGYLNIPEQTVAKFVPDCFSPNPGNMLYKTGDIGVLLPNNDLIFVGRKNNQVKIRGHRVELDGIKNRALLYEGVRDSIALFFADHVGDPYISLFVVSDDSDLTEAKLRHYLNLHLPQYSVPSKIRLLSEFPINTVGKVDRDTLKGYRNIPHKTCEAETDSISNDLSGVRVLVNSEFGSIVDFNSGFIANGGNSLLALRLAAKFRKWFNIEVNVHSLIACLSLDDFIDNLVASTPLTTNRYYVTEPTESNMNSPDQGLKFTSVQERLWKKHCFAPDAPILNLPNLIRIQGHVHADHLLHALRKLLSSNLYMRCVYENDKQGLRTKELSIAEALSKCLTVITLDETGNELEHLNNIIDNIHKAFDLSQDPPIRVKLYVRRTAHPDSCFLLTVVHHLVADGQSLPMIHEQLWRNYENSLCGNNTDDADEPYQPTSTVDTGTGMTDMKYWVQLLQETDLSSLPFLMRDVSCDTGPANALTSKLSCCQFDNLRRFCQHHALTPASVMLSLFQCVLGIIGQREEVIVCVPVTTRDHQGGVNNTGPAFNVLPCKAKIRGQPFSDICREVQEQILAAAAHATVPLADSVSTMFPDSPAESRRVLDNLMDVMYIYLSFKEASYLPPAATGLTGEYLPLDEYTTWPRNGLTLFVTDCSPEGPFRYTLWYDSVLLDKRFMTMFQESYMQHFEKLVRY